MTKYYKFNPLFSVFLKSTWFVIHRNRLINKFGKYGSIYESPGVEFCLLIRLLFNSCLVEAKKINLSFNVKLLTLISTRLFLLLQRVSASAILNIRVVFSIWLVSNGTKKKTTYELRAND